MTKNFLFGVLFLFLIVNLASAHLDAGRDITNKGYIIDFGYAPANLHVGEVSEFTVNLVNETTEIPINFSSVLARISSDNGIIFAGELKGKAGNSILSYTFPSGGNYTVDFRFMNENNKLIEQGFNVGVSARINYSLIGVIAIILIIFIILISKRKRK